MEPLTVFLCAPTLAAAILTAAPRWDLSMGTTTRVMVERTDYISHLLATSETAELSASYPFSPAQFPSQVQRIISELTRYGNLNDGWGGDGSVAPDHSVLIVATSFIQHYPAGLELPSPMISYEGEIGFYWSSETGYIDLEIEGQGKASLYTRNRKTGKDNFINGIDLSTIDRCWYEEMLSVLEVESILNVA